MNDLEDRLSAHFAQRAQGVQVNPDVLAALQKRVQHRRAIRKWRLPALVAAVVATIVAVAIGIFSAHHVLPATSGPPTAHSTGLPAIGASPSDVLDAYPGAFTAHDCATASTLTTRTFTHGNGELCGDVTIDSFTRAAGGAVNGNEITYAITLHVVTGSKDCTIPAGDVTWFYELRHQPDGSWKIVGGGSGP